MLTETIAAEINGFTKEYGNSSGARKALDKVNFRAYDKTITGLLGPNGAGKSTLLKALTGIISGSEGRVKIFGEEDLAEIRKITAFVPEIPELDKRLTVKETLHFEKMLFASSEETMEMAIETCSLQNVLAQKTHTLSKGFRQRTSLAKALCRNPKLLVLDEFSEGLDPNQNSELRTALGKISESIPVILSTHRIEEARNICSRIFILSDGHNKAEGTVQEITENANCKSLEEAFLKLTAGELQ